jgi:sulfate/thiosulfate transport system permease protein
MCWNAGPAASTPDAVSPLPRTSAPPRQATTSGTEEPAVVKWLLIGVSVAFLLVFLILPLANVFVQALAKGWSFYWAALNHANTRSAIRLTLIVAGITLPINVLFGLAAAWAITKFQFRGKAVLLTLIDLPFSVSPVVAGLMYVLVFGLQGLLGPWLDTQDIQIIFALPGIALTTLFVTLPFVARELVPVMQATGSEQEQAALTLGASGWTTFWHVTLPSVKWGLLYGIILCNARAIGEFGAVSVVSGHIAGKTDTMPLAVEKLYQEFNATAAFSVASLLALLALFTLAIKSYLEWKTERNYRLAQHVAGEAESPLEHSAASAARHADAAS